MGLLIRYNDGRTLRVFENTVLTIFGPERALAGEQRKLHNEELFSVTDDRLIG